MSNNTYQPAYTSSIPTYTSNYQNISLFDEKRNYNSNLPSFNTNITTKPNNTSFLNNNLNTTFSANNLVNGVSNNYQFEPITEETEND